MRDICALGAQPTPNSISDWIYSRASSWLNLHDGPFEVLYRIRAATGVTPHIFWDIRAERASRRISRELGDRRARVEFGKFFMELDPTDVRDSHLLRLKAEGRTYEPEVTNFMLSNVREGDVTVDIGANRGYFTMLMSRLVGQSGVVYAFEPAPMTFRRLVDNLRLNGCDNVRATNAACSNQSGNVKLHLSATDEALNSLVPLEAESGVVEVPSETLDVSLSRASAHNVSLIKIDVEGFERQVLEGLHNTLTSSADVRIVFEYSKRNLHRAASDYNEVFSLLQGREFHVRTLNPDGSIGRAIHTYKDVGSLAANLVAFRY